MTHNTFAIAATAYGLTCQSISPVSAVDIEVSKHPYFQNVNTATPQDDVGVACYLDGKLVPQGFSINVGGLHKDCPPLQFVLVKPQNIDVDGISFDVHRPFYIATTELSNVQSYYLDDRAWDSYDAFVAHHLELAQNQFNMTEDFVHDLAHYFRQKQLPRLGIDVRQASIMAPKIGSQLNMIARMPTCAEWFVAMRGGTEQAYWWGNDVDLSQIAWRSNAHKEVSSFKFLRNTNAGQANQFGIYNILGNAGELVFPSDEERALLRLHFGPWAKRARDTEALLPGYSIRSYSAFSLGGSVDTQPSFRIDYELPQFVAAFRQQTLFWKDIILDLEIIDTPVWRHRGGWTGVRFAIELPPGSVEFRQVVN